MPKAPQNHLPVNVSVTVAGVEVAFARGRIAMVPPNLHVSDDILNASIRSAVVAAVATMEVRRKDDLRGLIRAPEPTKKETDDADPDAAAPADSDGPDQ